MRVGAHVIAVALAVTACTHGTRPEPALAAPSAIPPTNTPEMLRQTVDDARGVREAVLLYLGEHPDGHCPTLEELRQDGALFATRPSQSTVDAWAHPFLIECDGDDILVRSGGPDGIEGTEDDLGTEDDVEPE